MFFPVNIANATCCKSDISTQYSCEYLSGTFSVAQTFVFINILLHFQNIRNCFKYPVEKRGTQWYSWLRHCATTRKVAGSIPDGVTGIVHGLNPTGCSMARGLTQSLTETSKKRSSPYNSPRRSRGGVEV
jgi:hypothetical protein